MPREIELRHDLLGERCDAEAGQDALEVAPMQHVELAERNCTVPHLVHGGLILAAPGIGEGEPIELVAERLQHGLGLARDAGAPVDQRAEHVEEQRACWRISWVGLIQERHEYQHSAVDPPSDTQQNSAVTGTPRVTRSGSRSRSSC